MFANADMSLESVASFAIDAYLGLESVEESDGKTVPAEWEPFLGSYLDDTGTLGMVDVVRTDSALSVHVRSFGLDLPLEQVRENWWQTTFLGTTVDATFWRDPADGPVSYLLTRGLSFRRVE